MGSSGGLESYGIFSNDVVDTLNGVAERLGTLSYQAALREFGIPEAKIHNPDGFKSVEVLDVQPKDGYDRTLVLQSEISTGIDPNTVMHIIPLVGSLPTTRVIAFGRPTRWGNKFNLLTLQQSKQVASGNFEPLAIPTLDYLTSESGRHETVKQAVHAGFSLGGDIVPEIPKHASKFGHKVQAIIYSDAVAGTTRSIKHLGDDFGRVKEAWEAYISEIQNPAYSEARGIGHNNNKLFIATAFARLSNLAIAAGLAKGGLEQRLEAGLLAQPEMVAVVSNCSESELSDSNVMNGIRERLQTKFGDRVRGGTLQGLGHAVNDQIYANAAIVLHGIKLAQR